MSPVVMVIDENPSVVELITQMLAQAGHVVVGCSDLARAEAVVNETNPDAVILELRRRNEYVAWSLLSRLRSNGRAKPLPVLVTSGDGSLLRRYDTDLEVMGVPVLAKPFTIDSLLTRLADLVRAANVVADAEPLESAWQTP